MASDCQSAQTSDDHEGGLTNYSIAEIMKEYRTAGGAPACEKTRQVYISRLQNLLKRGALRVLDQPDVFKTIMKVDERPAASNLSFLKPVVQFIGALRITSKWFAFYTKDPDGVAIAYRQLVRDMNIRQRAEAENRRQNNGSAKNKVGSSVAH